METITQYVTKRENVQEPTCVGMSSVARVSTRLYEVKNGKTQITSYSLRIPITEPSVKPQAKSIPEVMQRRMLESVFPEIVGAGLGGVMLLTASLYSFAMDLSSAGVALIGPAIAGVFGAIALWALNRNVKNKKNNI